MAQKANAATTRRQKIKNVATEMARTYGATSVTGSGKGYDYVAKCTADLANDLNEQGYGNHKLVSALFDAFSKSPELKNWEIDDGRKRRFFLSGYVGTLWTQFEANGKDAREKALKKYSIAKKDFASKIPIEQGMTLVGSAMKKLDSGKMTLEDFGAAVLKAPVEAVEKKAKTFAENADLAANHNMGVRAHAAAKALSKVLIGTSSSTDNANPLVLSKADHAKRVKKVLDDALVALLALAYDDQAAQMNDADIGKFLPDYLDKSDVKACRNDIRDEWTNGAVEEPPESTQEGGEDDDEDDGIVVDDYEPIPPPKNYPGKARKGNINGAKNPELPDDIAEMFAEEVAAFQTRLARKLAIKK